MNIMSNDKKSELKKFLEEKIGQLKKEQEYYEFLLAILESGISSQKQNYQEEKEESVEIKVNKKSIAIISMSSSYIKLRPLFDVEKNEDMLKELKKDIELIAEDAKTSVIEDRNLVKEISIEIKKLTPLSIKGISEALKLFITDYYKNINKISE
ncbi:hypothetical protein IOK49_06665 [Fervidicoccus fontis]|uniref:Uncharacterized protein n=3 Tax=Fervidicoccus fontis TaxID=683846 RepID=H9ZZY8_FERFK|nr:hypothetical protein FFONT_0305 [Fervidicoccus fontis Kam940]MBE9391745.1 hypothetical protein [Fervidicoccus fontis]